MINNRRESYEIASDILKVARNGAKKSHLVYKANLNFSVIRKYLEVLLQSGLLMRTNRTYRTTEKGKTYIASFGALEETLTTIYS